MALIKCTECGKEISEKATTCPNCGAPISPNGASTQHTSVKVDVHPEKKKGSCLKTILIVFAVIVILGVIGSTMGGKDDEVKDVTSTSDESSDKTSEESKETSKTEFAVGETAEYKNVQISVTDYQESNGNDWGTPEDGNVFLFLNVEVTNNSDEEISISSLMSFEAYCDDYKIDFSSNALMAMSSDKMQQLDGSIASGKKLNGYLGIEVPSDWTTVEVYYKDNVWLDSNFKFIITK